MIVRTCCCAILLSLLGVLSVARGAESSFRFLATGDLPYSASQEEGFLKLIEQSKQEDFAFLMHVGDFKAQRVPCSNEEFGKIRNLFKAYPKPVIYTPGDNEWTDCHGVGSDPIERLAKIRELFYHDESVLRLKQLQAVPQSNTKQFAKFVENYRFKKAGVLFVVAHVCGSGNNHREGHAASMEEFKERNAANLAFLEEGYALAIKENAPGVVLVIHANPDFENDKQTGFHDFIASVRGFLAKYDKPVVCIHGDSHYYRIDKPLKDTNKQLLTNFTRMEVFGSPNVAGVAVTVDPSDPEVFSYRPYYLKK